LAPTGQWNLFSFWPNNPPAFHASGMSVDLAWDVTTGDPDVVIVVLDTGVNYDHEDLRRKIWLNRGELPPPNGGSCAPPAGDPHDCNADGAFTIEDYAGDSRITDTLLPGILSRSDLRVFEDGVDDDANGFADDISGWDARDGDHDEFRTNGDGHGTGRNGFAAADTDNGVGIAGICPDCRLANIRVDGSFVTRTESPAIGAIWAADHGHEVIVMALGATGASSMSRAAFDYATRNNVLALNATANEFSFHQNFQTIFDDVMGIGAVVPDQEVLVTTYLRKGNFSNYGAHTDVVTPSDSPTTSGGSGYSDSSGTSSAVPQAGGVAALVFSRARELIDLGILDTSGLSLPDISAQEVRQIINRTADDVVQLDDPLGPYAYQNGWDRWTGYGRINARAAVDLVGPGTIPPEADINQPDWYRRVNGVVDVELYANARWASTFGWVLEYGPGVEPGSFTQIASGTSVSSDPSLSSADLASNFVRSWNTSSLADGFYTLRLRVTDDLGNDGEDRMGVWVLKQDPTSHPGWPQTLPSSIESIGGSALVDLDGDNALDIIFSTADGQVHAFRHDGSEVTGFPVSSDPVADLPTCCSAAFDGNPNNGEVPVTSASLTGGVAVADIDSDGVQEICAGSYNGRVYCWNADGTPQPGFPVETDLGTTVDQYSGAHLANTRGEAVLAPPTLEDLDGDGELEIIAGAFDQQMYIWRSDGTRLAPWPLAIFDSAQVAGIDPVRPSEIISSPVVADIDDDGAMEIVFGTNEVYATPNLAGQGGSARLYAYESDGTLESGWPVSIVSLAPDAVPLVATGAGTSLIAADIDGDDTLEIAGGILLSDATLLNHDGSTFATMLGAFTSLGLGGDGEETTAEGGLGRATDTPVHYYVGLGAFADVDDNGQLDYMVGTIGNAVAGLAVGSGIPTPFDHFFSVWNAMTGVQRASFPRVMEDWQFYTGPAVVDIDGAPDGLPEMIVASGGYFVHAFKGGGTEPAGWPKNVGQWVVSSPSVGDVDGDGLLEVVVATRLGDIHVWDTAAAACGSAPWRKALHDEWNTGVFGKDTRRPARIDDLAAVQVGTGSVMLTWTAVGDDGDCGTADTYELWASAAPIDESNFTSATAVAAPSPAPAGTAEQFTFPLPPGARYFALRAVDGEGNAGPIAIAGPLSGCGTPQAGCKQPVESGRTFLLLKNGTPDQRDRVRWKWRRGASTTRQELGNPMLSTGYDVCLYDGDAMLLVGVSAPPSGICAFKPCWKETKKGFQYKNRTANPPGFLKIDLRSGDDGKAKITVKGKGSHLGGVPLPLLDLPVTMQIRNTDGVCWEASFSTDFVSNDKIFHASDQ
jgi:hypothetical protein